MRSYKKWASIIIILFAFALGILDRPAQAASSKFIPRLLLNYNYNSNVASVDPDLVDPVTLQWVSYLVGLDASFKTQYYLLQLGGSAGYSQYMSSSADLKDLWDVNYGSFNYYNLDLHGLFSYTRPNFAIDLADDLKRNRLISDIFQTPISELSDVYLYTDNVASAQIHFQIKQPLSFLFRYEYETLVYEQPPSDALLDPADSTRQTVFGKVAYTFNPRASISLDLQGNQWLYGDATIAGPGGTEITMDIVDYYYYYALLTFTYNLTSRTSMSVSGGARQTQYSGAPEGRDFQDHLLPLARISLTAQEKFKYLLGLGGEYAESTYGQNLFFSYWMARANFEYYFGKHLHAGIGGSYRPDTYDRDKLGLGNVWAENRLDSVIMANAGVTWDILMKYDQAYLSLNASGTYNLRDSNIDGEVSDYVPGYPGVFYSYDTQVTMFAVGVAFNPTILIGPR